MNSAEGNYGITRWEKSHSPHTANVRDQNSERKKLFVASTKIMDDKNVRAQHLLCSLNQRKRLVLMNCGRVYYFAETKIDIAYHAHRTHTPNKVRRCLKLAHNKTTRKINIQFFFIASSVRITLIQYIRVLLFLLLLSSNQSDRALIHTNYIFICIPFNRIFIQRPFLVPPNQTHTYFA